MENTDQEAQAPAPFSSTYTPSLPELLRKLKCSILISTYQAGKVVCISGVNDARLSQLPRTFAKPMGVAVDGARMAIACRNEIITLENSPELAGLYPNKPDTYDALFVPRTTHYTGYVDMHDIAFGAEGIWAVNTSFSCICLINGQHNFIPKWKPPFIDELVGEDRCHLNGLVLKDGYPHYVTALGTTNTAKGWREEITTGGILMDVRNNEVILDGLAMPHSPTMYKGELYMLLSATGEFIKVNVEERTYTVIKQLKGFCRGLDIIGDYAFIGMSKLRQNSSTFAKLPFAKDADQAGIKVLHIPTGALVEEISYQLSVDEIYEIKILEGVLRPNILNTENPIHKYSLSLPGKTFWADPKVTAD